MEHSVMIVDVRKRQEEVVQRWHAELAQGGCACTIPPVLALLELHLCQMAISNANEMGSPLEDLGFPRDMDEVAGLQRLLARQLVWSARERSIDDAVTNNRAFRFQMAMGLPLTKKYDIATAMMAFKASGARPEDVPAPVDVGAPTGINPQDLWTLFRSWMSVSRPR